MSQFNVVVLDQQAVEKTGSIVTATEQYRIAAQAKSQARGIAKSAYLEDNGLTDAPVQRRDSLVVTDIVDASNQKTLSLEDVDGIETNTGSGMDM